MRVKFFLLNLQLNISLFLLLQFSGAGCLYAQHASDSAWVKPFQKDNNIQIYGGYAGSSFIFQTKKTPRDYLHLLANNSGYTGVNVNYKFLSLFYEFTLPYTSLADRKTGLRSRNLELSQFGSRFGIEASYQHVNGMLFEVRRRRADPPVTFEDIRYRKYALNLYLFANPKHFSYSAANYYSKLQQQSAGSWMFMVSPEYQQFSFSQANLIGDEAKDSMVYELVKPQPTWVSTIGYVGYSCNLVMDDGHWSISPTLLLGAGGQYPLYDSRFNPKQITLVYSALGRVNCGYNGEHFFSYLSASHDYTRNHLPAAHLHLQNSDFSITFGYRFSALKHKILGVI